MQTRGFLSENEKFTQACTDAGIKFIGAGAASMEMMGSTRAPQEMDKAGIHFSRELRTGWSRRSRRERWRRRSVIPVMLKAAAGGSSKGMRLVGSEQELQPALEAAQSEAGRNSDSYLEKAILNPRHPDGTRRRTSRVAPSG